MDEKAIHGLQKRPPFSGIVARLRLLLVVVALVTITASLTGFSQLREISTTHQALTERALPFLLDTQAVERELSEMIVALDAASAATSTEMLAAVKTDVDQRLEKFREKVQNVVRTRGASDLTERITAGLDELDLTAQLLLDRKKQLLRDGRRIDEMQQDLTAIRARARETLRALQYKTTRRIEAQFGPGMASAEPQSSLGHPPIPDLFLKVQKLTTLSRDLEAVIDIADRRRNVTEMAALQTIRADLERELQHATAILTELDPSPHRAELTGLFIRLSELLMSNEGMIAISRDQLVHQKDLLDLRQERIGVTEEISRQIGELTAHSTATVENRSQHFSDAMRLLSLILVVCLFLAAIVTLIGNSIIIEKQINRRMERLSTAVRAIANGDLDHPIDVSGQDELGEIAGALSIFKQNAEELRRSNVDLERFAYVAAHDLRAPLRAVHDLAEWTLEDEENELSADSCSYLDMMKSRARRLDRLLTDLLNYARAGYQDGGMEDVDMTGLVDHIDSMLNPSRRFSIRFTGEVRRFRTHVTPLTQILINLISNAIKHHDQGAGTITVSTSLVRGRLLVEVADDGPGIPREYQDRAYELFQTLRPRDEVEGSGLGLAIIRKLLDRYNAEIDLDSDPAVERGARFRFDFPAEEIRQQMDAPEADAA